MIQIKYKTNQIANLLNPLWVPWGHDGGRDQRKEEKKELKCHFFYFWLGVVSSCSLVGLWVPECVEYGSSEIK